MTPAKSNHTAAVLAALGRTYGQPTAPPNFDIGHLMQTARRLGVTRLADITGLDRVGIPVVQAVRPLARSNAVSQGKGTDLEAAAIAALMEAAETFFAERIDPGRLINQPMRRLEAEGLRTLDLDRRLRAGARDRWWETEVPWIEGLDLSNGEIVLVPYALVHTCYLSRAAAHEYMVWQSTTGLAAGWSTPAVVRHALLEVIERDAIARAFTSHAVEHARRLDLDTIEDSVCRTLIQRFRSAGLAVGLWLLEGAAGAVVAWCRVIEDGGRSSLISYEAEGFAAALDTHDAIRRALLEAAASRLAVIAGARDDLTRRTYPRYPDQASIAASRRLLARSGGPIDARTTPGETADPADQVATLVQRLTMAGHGPVLAVAVGGDPESGVGAVRILVPALTDLRN